MVRRPHGRQTSLGQVALQRVSSLMTEIIEPFPWGSIKLPEECSDIHGMYSATGEARGGDYTEGSKQKVYNSVFPFQDAPSSVAFFYLKPVNENSETEVALYNDRKKLLQVKRYPLKLTCDDVWWRYTYSKSGGGDGSSVSKIENTTKIVRAADGSLIVWNTYIITRSKLIFFRSEQVIETWYRFPNYE